jgi:hypothetical protein
LSKVLTENDFFCGLFCKECLCSNKHKEFIKDINPTYPADEKYILFKTHKITHKITE